MTGDIFRKAAFGIPGLAAAVGLALAPGSVGAQSAYGPDRYDTDYGYDNGYSGGELTVIAPYSVGRSSIGAPIRDVFESRVVETDDLDLATRWGARELRLRIERAARDACDELAARYPVSDGSTPDCYGKAVRRAMLRAEDALGYAPPDWPDLG